MRNFYIESSLGTFISDAAAAERVPKEEPGKPAKGAGSGFSAGVYHSDTRSSVDQISKARSKMGRQRIRRRRRRKRSLTEQQQEEDEEEQERKQEENTLEVLSRRHGHNKDGVSDDSVSDNVVTKRSDDDNIRKSSSSSRSNKSSSKSKSVADVRRNTAKTGRIEEKANAHHRDNTNEATTRITTTSKTTFSRPHNSKSADNSVESVVDEKVKVGGERTRMKRESSNSSEKKRKNGANCRNKNVWIENFVYSPTFTVKWRFSQWDLQQLMNGTSSEPPVISFR